MRFFLWVFLAFTAFCLWSAFVVGLTGNLEATEENAVLIMFILGASFIASQFLAFVFAMTWFSDTEPAYQEPKPEPEPREWDLAAWFGLASLVGVILFLVLT